MTKKSSLLPLLAVLLIFEATFGKGNNRTSEIYKTSTKDRLRDEVIKYRNKRQLENKALSTGSKGEAAGTHYNYNIKLIPDPKINGKVDVPFWANRGRRETLSEEHYVGQEYPSSKSVETKDKNCKQCKNFIYKQIYSNNIDFTKKKSDKLYPSGNRGKRSLSEYDDADDPPNVFWGSRGRRQEDDPFWGARGRRQDESPFWGARGRRQDDSPFWGARGRRQDDSPFWGARGRRLNMNPDLNSRNDGREPFWGNRGRREKSESSGEIHNTSSFGRSRANEPFWGSRGRREKLKGLWGDSDTRPDGDTDPFWGSRGRRDDDVGTFIKTMNDKIHLKDLIQNAINAVNRNIAILSNYQLDINHGQNQVMNKKENFDGKAVKSSVASTVLSSDVYAEQPNFVLIDEERNPFFGSRGKKKNYNMVQAARDRRGAIEEIVKSVRNDPYYIARGKKEAHKISIGNSTIVHKELINAKDFICSTVTLIMEKYLNNKVKRDIDDNERDRRTILKKLAAQLQIDPYFVSRGKKNGVSDNQAILEEFINAIYIRCE